MGIDWDSGEFTSERMKAAPGMRIPLVREITEQMGVGKFFEMYVDVGGVSADVEGNVWLHLDEQVVSEEDAVEENKSRDLCRVFFTEHGVYIETVSADFTIGERADDKRGEKLETQGVIDFDESEWIAVEEIIQTPEKLSKFSEMVFYKLSQLLGSSALVAASQEEEL